MWALFLLLFCFLSILYQTAAESRCKISVAS